MNKAEAKIRRFKGMPDGPAREAKLAKLVAEGLLVSPAEVVGDFPELRDAIAERHIAPESESELRLAHGDR